MAARALRGEEHSRRAMEGYRMGRLSPNGTTASHRGLGDRRLMMDAHKAVALSGAKVASTTSLARSTL
jgi:hypothetical protein